MKEIDEILERMKADQTTANIKAFNDGFAIGRKLAEEEYGRD